MPVLIDGQHAGTIFIGPLADKRTASYRRAADVSPGTRSDLLKLAALASVVAEHLPLRFLTRKVLDSPVYQHFADGAPGLKEIAVLGQALRVVRGIGGNGVPRVDLVVLDAPATGHGVSLLSAPALVSDSIREGPLGRMAGELAEFVAELGRPPPA